MACTLLDRLVDPFRQGFVSTFVKRKFGTFLDRHFKHTGHLPSKALVHPVEKNIYDPNSNSSSKLENIKRHNTELHVKWITFLLSP